jgi:hypothetical protein
MWEKQLLRCFKSLYLKWKPDYAGNLERERNKIPNQPKRIESYPAGSREMEGAFIGTGPTVKNRQSSSLLLFEERGREKRGAE